MYKCTAMLICPSLAGVDFAKQEEAHITRVLLSEEQAERLADAVDADVKEHSPQGQLRAKLQVFVQKLGNSPM